MEEKSNKPYFKCGICGHEVESINDFHLCGHCKKISCPNCNNPIDYYALEEVKKVVDLARKVLSS